MSEKKVVFIYENSSIHVRVDVENGDMFVRSSVLFRRLEGDETRGSFVVVSYDSTGSPEEFGWYSQEKQPDCPEHVILNMSKALEHMKLFKVRQSEVQ